MLKDKKVPAVESLAGHLQKNKSKNAFYHDLDTRLRLFQQQTGGQSLDYEQLRQAHQQQANQEVEKIQQVSRYQRIAHLIEQADLNPSWTFEHLDHHDPLLVEAIRTAHAFVQGFENWEKQGGGGLYIYGDYGTGKSTLAGAIAHDLIRHHQRSVIFQQWISVIDRLFFGVGVDQIGRYRYRQALETVDLLVIDEIAANRSQLNENQSTYLGHLLRRRRNLSKNVILISNHTPESLHQALGDFCFEAFKSFAVVGIHLAGESRRPAFNGYAR